MIFSSTSKIDTGDTFWKTLKSNINRAAQYICDVATICAVIAFIALILCFAISLLTFNKHNASLFKWLGVAIILDVVAGIILLWPQQMQNIIGYSFQAHRLNAPEARKDLKDLLHKIEKKITPTVLEKPRVSEDKPGLIKVTFPKDPIEPQVTIPTVLQNHDSLDSKTGAELYSGFLDLWINISYSSLRHDKEIVNCAEKINNKYLVVPPPPLPNRIILAASVVVTIGICIRPVYQSFSR